MTDAKLWMTQETDGEETETDDEFMYRTAPLHYAKVNGEWVGISPPASPPASPATSPPDSPFTGNKGKGKRLEWPGPYEEEISESEVDDWLAAPTPAGAASPAASPALPTAVRRLPTAVRRLRAFLPLRRIAAPPETEREKRLKRRRTLMSWK